MPIPPGGGGGDPEGALPEALFWPIIRLLIRDPLDSWTPEALPADRLEVWPPVAVPSGWVGSPSVGEPAGGGPPEEASVSRPIANGLANGPMWRAGGPWSGEPGSLSVDPFDGGKLTRPPEPFRELALG